MKRLSVTVLALLILFSGVGYAAGLEEALETYRRGDFVAAHKTLTVLAGAGNMDAALPLARMYEKGEGVPQNDSLAWSWYQRAAISGRAEASFRVAEFFETGRGVPISLKDAAEWYERAANKGHIGAMVRAGRIYATGIGVRPDVSKAIAWLARAQEEGDGEAETLLASLSARGLTVQSEPPGETNPKDERAAKVLQDVRTILAPFLRPPLGKLALKLGGEPRIMARDDGYMVFLPGVEVLGLEEGTLVVGTLRILMSPEDGDRYRMDVTLPNRMRIVDGAGKTTTRLSIGQQTAKGLWSMPLASALQADISYEQVAVDTLSGKAASVTIGAIKSKLSNKDAAEGLLDMEETLDFENFLATNRETGDVFQIGKFSIGSAIKGMRPTASQEILASLGFGDGASPPPGKPPISLVDVADSFNVVISTSGVHMTRGGAPMKLGLTEISLAVGEMRKPLGHIRFGLKIKDAKPPVGTIDESLVPNSITLQAIADRIPGRRLIELSQAMIADALLAAPSSDSLNTVLAALAAAGSELRMEETSISAEAYDIHMSGSLRPTPDSAVLGAGELLVEVRGLNVLLATLMKESGADGKQASDAALVAALEQAGKKGTDAQGRPTLSYRVALPPGGGVKVNGKELAELLGSPPESTGKKGPPPAKKRP